MAPAVGDGPAPPHRCARSRSVRAFDKTIEAGAARPTSSIDPHAGVGQRGRRARHAPGLRGDLLDKAVLFLRRQHVAARARRGSVPLADAVPVRNREWFHMVNDDVISMPDKWEYPWYAAWDLAFHAVALAGVDLDFAKHQLNLMLKARYQHSNGSSPPTSGTSATSTRRCTRGRRSFNTAWSRRSAARGTSSSSSAPSASSLINFTWWVNRKDRLGKSVFEGGFLGLDNIGVFDRSAELPTGGYLEQADGTAWMAMFCQNMLEIAVELAAHDPSYEDLVYKFAEHFLWIGAAMNKVGDDGMWDEEDGFYYDVLRLPDGTRRALKVRSMVGLLPLCATTVIEPWQRERVPRAVEALASACAGFRSSCGGIHPIGPGHANAAGRTIAALVDPERLRRILSRMLDEQEFLGPYGIRSLSRFHEQHPYVVRRRREGVPRLLPAGRVGQRDVRRELQLARPGVVPDERAPHPRAAPVLRLLRRLLPRGMPHRLRQADDALRGCEGDLRPPSAHLPARRAPGRRPVFGGTEKFQTDPHWRDCIPFYEYFHGDNGAGLGASHQTGWTACVATLAQIFGSVDGASVFESGIKGTHRWPRVGQSRRE